jgi:hypothetical protein
MKIVITSIQFLPVKDACKACQDAPYWQGRATAWFDIELENGEVLRQCNYILDGDMKAAVALALADIEKDIIEMLTREMEDKDDSTVSL